MVHFNFPFYPFQWYKNKNPVSGNAGQFNYKVMRDDDELAAYCWMGMWCMEKTKDVKEKRFPFEEASVKLAEEWLHQEFDSHTRKEIESKEGFFTTEPYTPPKPAEEEADEAPF